MGNGACIPKRYKAAPADGTYDTNTFRKPKERPAKDKGGSGGESKSSKTAAGGPTVVSVPEAWKAKAPAVHQAQEKGGRHLPPTPVHPTPDDDDDDDDLANFSDLAGAADKIWDDLMAQKKADNGGARKDFSALFLISDMKDGVERAAKRAEVLQREAALCAATLDARKRALDDMSRNIEETALPSTAHVWKLGDMAIRRGKGFCEISTVHHQADPPYFEVRMFAGESVVGTETAKLIPITGEAQQTLVRSALKSFDQASRANTKADEAHSSAKEDLMKQHESIAELVEKKLHDTSAKDAGPAAGVKGGGGAPGPGLPGGLQAPPGMPQMNQFKHWTGMPDIPGGARMPAAGVKADGDYPDMKGVKEDLRGSQAKPPQNSAVTPPGSAKPSSAAPKAGGTTGGGPPGFPSAESMSGGDRQDAPQGSGSAFSYRKAAAAAAAAGHGGSKERPQGGAPAGFPGIDPTASAPPGPSAPPSMGARAPQQPQQPQTDWVAYRTADNQVYYHNERTAETSWQLPVGAVARDGAAQQNTAYGQQQDAGSYAQQQAQYAQQAQYGQQAQYAQQQQGPSAYGPGSYYSQQTGAAGAEDDPFAGLRQQEEQMKQQRDQWAQWYTNYCSWYQGQAQQAHQQAQQPGAGQPGAHGAQGHGPAGSAGQRPAEAKLPPKGPAAPKLDASFEDNALYVMKSAILKEMEAMVEQGKPVSARKKALKILQMRWHPDKNPDREEVAKSVFQFIEGTKPWFLYEAEGDA